MTHLVLNKENKKFYGGFTKTGKVIWAIRSKAKAMDFQSAKCQAALLICNDHPVQRKPVLA